MKKVRKKKSEYLSYIEETSKHIGKLKKVAAKATRDAVTLTQSRDLPITYKKGNIIVREYSNGRKETIGVIQQPSIKVTKGATIQLY